MRIQLYINVFDFHLRILDSSVIGCLAAFTCMLLDCSCLLWLGAQIFPFLSFIAKKSNKLYLFRRENR